MRAVIGSDVFPARLNPGVLPVLILGPFTVEWDGIRVAIGHTLVTATNPSGATDVRWHDGARWHFLDESFLDTLKVTGNTVAYEDALGRMVTFRPVELADKVLLFPVPGAQTLAGLLTALKVAWKPGTL